jgi:hypothetical protein
LLVLALPSEVSGQHAQVREGFGIGFGFGLGSAGASCDGCDSDRESGLSGYLRLGGYVRPNLMLAFESNGYVKSADGVDYTVGFYSAVAQWYPTATNGFFLKGGLGVSGYAATDGLDELSLFAPGINLGLGYDARLGRNFSLTPYVNFLASGKADAELNGISSGFKVSTNLLQVGIGFNWH